ncbi:MAG: histidine phosphatase family protein [Candidatus Limnocylindrales bacterium]
MSRAGGPPLLPADLTASIVLLRHGESTYIVEGRFQGRADPPLSPRGERQAALAADRLASPARPPALPITPSAPVEIVHSPLGRAAATAHAVAVAIGGAGSAVPIRADPDLIEISQGEWEGRTQADIEARDLELLNAWRRDATRAVAPGGERIAEAAVRARTGLERTVTNLRAVAEPDPDSILRPVVDGYRRATGLTMPWTLAVAHDGILKVMVLTLFDLPLDRFWSFPFALCGISVVELRGGRALLRAHNLGDHLATLEAADAAEATAGNDGKERGGAL